MLEAGRKGKIIFTASLLTFQGGINVPGYAASKGGVGQLAKAFANEWAAKGINVNAIAPGYIATDNTEALRNDPERAGQSLHVFPPADGERAEIWQVPPSFWHQADRTTCTAPSSRLMEAGWLVRIGLL